MHTVLSPHTESQRQAISQGATEQKLRLMFYFMDCYELKGVVFNVPCSISQVQQNP